MNVVNVEFKRLPHAEGLPLPARQTLDAAGIDLPAALERPLILQPGERAAIPTGFAIALPAGHEAQVRPRSGLAVKHGVTVLNAPGTIDADYRGEILVPLINHGSEPFSVEHGMRIAQMVVVPVSAVRSHEVQELTFTSRGDRGFGSTGYWSGPDRP